MDTDTDTDTGPENKYHVLELSISNMTIFPYQFPLDIQSVYAKCYKCDKSVAIDYYIAKSDPKTTWTLLMTYNIVKTIKHRQTHSQNISDIHINRRNGISTITHSYRKNPCAFHCKNPFRTLKAKINYNCHYTTMITRSHIVPT